jgi:hypothetical protein
MNVVIQPDDQSSNLLAPDAVQNNIFASATFRQLLAEAFHLQAVQLHLSDTTAPEKDLTIPAFLRKNLLGKQTVILGAGFDKTGIIPDLAMEHYGQIVEKLRDALAATPVEWLEIRTTHHIPCLHDEADKVELNVDITPSVEAVWNSLSTNTRKNIRRPLKRGFTSVVGKTPALLDEFYQLYRMSLHDIGSLPHPKRFFSDLLTQCYEQMNIFVGYMDGIPVVSSVSFESPDEIYGAWSGIHTDYKKHNVFLAMLWKMIEYCGETGRKTYNLGRSSEGSNPHQFKLKLANRVHKIYYYRLKIASNQTSHSRIQTAASWVIRNTPSVVMDGLARTLMHKFY